jgi:translation initiation factor IF-1
MKIKRFKVDVYNWEVTLIETTSPEDWKKVKKKLIKFGVPKEDIIEAKGNIKKVNGGEHFYQVCRKESLILLYPMKSKKARTEMLCHEKRHLENRIFEFCQMDDNEASGYLAGYLGRKMI